MNPADNLSVTRGIGLTVAVTQFEQWYLWWALDRNDFNQSTTAVELQIHRNTLVNRIRDWDWSQKVQSAYESRHKHLSPLS